MTLTAPNSRIVAGIVIVAILAVAIAVVSRAFSPSSALYTDPANRFSVQVPADTTTQDFHAADGSSETLILRSGSDIVQITITPWTGSDTLTEDNLAPEFPSVADVSPQQIAIAGKVGIVFEDSPEGDSNIWLASRGYLYQLVEFGSRSDFLVAVIARWTFF